MTPALTRSTETHIGEHPDTEDGPVAHIVRTEPGEDARAKVLEARVEGIPLKALCGVVWVPSRDPSPLDVCGLCQEIYDLHRLFAEGLVDTPSA